MPNIGEIVSNFDKLKELIAVNPKIAFYIYIICLVIIGTKFAWIVAEWICNKIRPDLPYKHVKDIKDNTTKIENLSKTIVRIESKISTLLDLKNKGKKS